MQDVSDDEELFTKFKQYVLSEEGKMKERLETVLYSIDATNTLYMVTGSGRLEKVCFLYSHPVVPSFVKQTLSTFCHSSIYCYFARCTSFNVVVKSLSIIKS